MYGNGHPDSPEAVALELMKLIREAEGEQRRGSNLTPRADLLALYAECLAAAVRTFRRRLRWARTRRTVSLFTTR